jgi:hypothetical protein
MINFLTKLLNYEVSCPISGWACGSASLKSSDLGKHIFSPSHFCPHQHRPSSLMMHVPVPQHLGSSVIQVSSSESVNNWSGGGHFGSNDYGRWSTSEMTKGEIETVESLSECEFYIFNLPDFPTPV